MEISFVKAMLNHCKLATESLSDFRAQFAGLSDEDKTWFRERLTIEYGYKIN